MLNTIASPITKLNQILQLNNLNM